MLVRISNNLFFFVDFAGNVDCTSTFQQICYVLGIHKLVSLMNDFDLVCVTQGHLAQYSILVNITDASTAIASVGSIH